MNGFRGCLRGQGLFKGTVPFLLSESRKRSPVQRWCIREVHHPGILVTIGLGYTLESLLIQTQSVKGGTCADVLYH